jgi:hypothetical protein
VFFNVLYIEVEEGRPSPMDGVSGAGLAAQRPNSPHGNVRLLVCLLEVTLLMLMCVVSVFALHRKYALDQAVNPSPQ